MKASFHAAMRGARRTALAGALAASLASLAGHAMIPVRLPLNEIHVPARAPEHRTIAVDFQQRTTRAPRRSCSLTFAASDFPSWSLTTIV